MAGSAAGAPAPADSGAPPANKPMVISVGETTIRYEIGSAEATAAIMKGVRPARASAVACYRSAATKDRGLRGKIVVQVVLDPGGAILSVRDGGSSLPDCDAVDCILRAFRTASFTELNGNCAGNVEVTEPMLFNPAP